MHHPAFENRPEIGTVSPLRCELHAATNLQKTLTRCVMIFRRQGNANPISPITPALTSFPNIRQFENMFAITEEMLGGVCAPPEYIIIHE
jgi:hypothetical protein